MTESEAPQANVSKRMAPRSKNDLRSLSATSGCSEHRLKTFLFLSWSSSDPNLTPSLNSHLWRRDFHAFPSGLWGPVFAPDLSESDLQSSELTLWSFPLWPPGQVSPITLRWHHLLKTLARTQDSRSQMPGPRISWLDVPYLSLSSKFQS